MSISINIIESIEPDKTEWGISLTDSNPKEEDYFRMIDKETAFRLKKRLAVHGHICTQNTFPNFAENLHYGSS